MGTSRQGIPHIVIYPTIAHKPKFQLNSFLKASSYQPYQQASSYQPTVFLIISILGVVINYLLKLALLGWIDRFSGALFGALKGLLIVSVLLIALTAFLPKGSPFIKDSLLSPHITLISEKMAKVVSKDMKHAFMAKIAELKKIWKKH